MTDDQEKAPQTPSAAIQAQQVVSVPAVYFNGFTLGLSNADINALLLLDGQPVARVNMSFTTAKTLVTLLDDLMSKLETVTERDIMTTRQVEEGLKKLSPGSAKP